MRAGFLPPADAARVRALLSDYTKQRILFFINADDARRTRIDERISQEEADLWAAVRGPACGLIADIDAPRHGLIYVNPQPGKLVEIVRALTYTAP